MSEQPVTRIVYHPAPAPDAAGRLVAAEPVELGADLVTALRWVRRRLALRAAGRRTVYTVEPLPAETRIVAVPKSRRSAD